MQTGFLQGWHVFFRRGTEAAKPRHKKPDMPDSHAGDITDAFVWRKGLLAPAGVTPSRCWKTAEKRQPKKSSEQIAKFGLNCSL